MIVRSYNPVWLFVDLNGKVADDTFYLYTLQNTLPYLPSPIWKDANQAVQWSDPIQFLANGTLPENLYWDDTQVYRLEIRQNNGIAPPSQADALIYLVENYIPSTGGGATPGVDTADTENQITNPQFATVNFTGSLVINTATTTEFAPGWSVITTGAGTLTLTQVNYTGSSWTPSNATNAATGLHIVNSGFSNVEFIQRFNGNGALWTGAQTLTDSGPGVAVNITASAQDPVRMVASVKYNDGAQNQVVINTNLNPTKEDIPGAVVILESTNVSLPATAWTELSINLTSSSIYELTSIQLVGQQIVQKIQYLQTTPQRQVDEEFNYFFPKLEFKPIPSYLVGWDFSLNPAQFGESGSLGAIGANTSGYAWDQTIIFQTVTDGVSWNRNGTDKAFFVAALSNTSFAMVQYIPVNIARDLLSKNCSVQLQGFVSAGTINGTVGLYYTTDTSLPDLKSPNFNSLVKSIAAGVPTVGNDVTNGHWVQVPNLYNANSVPFQFSTSEVPISIAGFNGIAGALTANYVAIVICFDTLIAPRTVNFDYISLCSGDIATQPSPQTSDEVLRECQFYYEKSYNNNDFPGVAGVTSGQRIAQMWASPTPGDTTAANKLNIARTFQIVYNTPKNTLTLPTMYSPVTGNAGVVDAEIANAGTFLKQGDVVVGTFWTPTASGQKSVEFLAKSTASMLTDTSGAVGNYTECYITYHFILDDRLGIVL